MYYNLNLLKRDISTEKHYLEKIVSKDAMEELEFDFSLIITKINCTMPLTDVEKEKVLYIYNRYRGTTEFVTADMLIYELHKEKL